MIWSPKNTRIAFLESMSYEELGQLLDAQSLYLADIANVMSGKRIKLVCRETSNDERPVVELDLRETS
jgi:hypothetical protein